jgi:predicted acylesterase/phospholipase RssA
MSVTENVLEAKDILRGKIASPEKMFLLAEALRKADQFGYARQLFGRLRKSPVSATELKESDDRKMRNALGGKEARVVLAQKHALCTYKDPDIPADVRHERAFGILEEVEDLSKTSDQETLGLAGAIFKRKWQLDGQKQNLERALYYYRRGSELGAAGDYGWNGINAAYTLDQLAHIESRSASLAGSESLIAKERQEEARAIRRRLTAELPPLAMKDEWLNDTWWFPVTVAEAHFGLGEYVEAEVWLGRAKRLVEGGQVSDWEYETTARQLAELMRLQRDGTAATQPSALEETPAWRVLEEFMTVNGRSYTAGVRSSYIGKVGLALSGGGFRASLFHIGVLAKLAEMDVLRSVEVLSCVSGGSIIGAHYYLEVRNLLQTKGDGEITREDYIQLVQRIERDFLDGVQSNFRTRVAAEVTTNFKTIFKRNYSRTDRIGELFEEIIYSKIEDGGGERPRWLGELGVAPLGEGAAFTPKKDNWRRSAKVPILIINATSINTGHNWQFTTAWMGEPAASINSEIDSNRQLRRMYYAEAPEGYQKFSLGRAVAASACVPGLLDPIVLDNLYPEITVRLVDGGVHDNQGVAGLLEQGCNVLLVSDASGQMEMLNNPSAGLLAVPLRSLDMLMARVRETQYEDLKARRNSSLLRGLMFLHLKKDLDADPIDWVGCQDPFDASDESRPVERRGALTSYGIRKDVQALLAAIRTDLDAFSDTEAYALMTSGYLMAEHEFKSCIEGFASREVAHVSWRFLALEEAMKKTGDARMMQLLALARSRAVKLWKYSISALPVASIGLTLAGFLIWLISYALKDVESGQRTETLGLLALLLLSTLSFIIAVSIVFGVPTLLLLAAIIRVRNRDKTWGQIISGLTLMFVGWIPARIRLHVFDKWYLGRGNIKDRTTETAPREQPAESRFSVKAFSDRIDRANTTESINSAIDQFNMVDAIGSLFKAKGYDVKCFPRDRDINPLQLNLDLYANNKSRRILAMVKTAKEERSVDWQTGSSLETAAWFMSSHSAPVQPPQQQCATGTEGAASPPGEVAAWLFLVDVEPHESLKPFEERGVLKVRSMRTEDIRRILESKPGVSGEPPSAAFSAEAERWLEGVGEFRSALAAPGALSQQMEV